MVLQAEVSVARLAAASRVQVAGGLQAMAGKGWQDIEKAVASNGGALVPAPAGPVILHALGDPQALVCRHGFAAAATGRRESTSTLELFQGGDDLVELLQ